MKNAIRIDATNNLAINHCGWRTGTETKAENRFQCDLAISSGLRPINIKVAPNLVAKRIGPHRLTGFGPADFDDMLARLFFAEVVIEACHPVDFRPAEV